MPTTTTAPRLTHRKLGWNKKFALSVISVMIRKVVKGHTTTPNKRKIAKGPKILRRRRRYKRYSRRGLLKIGLALTAMPPPPRSSTAIGIRRVAVAHLVAIAVIPFSFTRWRPGIAASATASAPASITMFPCSGCGSSGLDPVKSE